MIIKYLCFQILRKTLNFLGKLHYHYVPNELQNCNLSSSVYNQNFGLSSIFFVITGPLTDIYNLFFGSYIDFSLVQFSIRGLVYIFRQTQQTFPAFKNFYFSISARKIEMGYDSPKPFPPIKVYYVLAFQGKNHNIAGA